MLLEVNAAVQSARALMDVVKANKQLADFSELNTAVSKLNAELARAWEMTLASQEKQATLQEEKAALTKRIGDLEKEIAQLKDWNREAERYALTQVTSGIPAYVLQSDMERDAITHQLCANCFGNYKKSFLQYGPPATRGRMTCSQCGGEWSPDPSMRPTRLPEAESDDASIDPKTGKWRY